MEIIGILTVPSVIAIILVSGFCGKVKIFDAFCDGAKSGLVTTFKIFPSLLGLIIAVSMLRASGVIDIITRLASPLISKIGMPPEVLPLALMRPLSGSGALAVITDIFKNYGTDSFIGKCASVMMGSTETTFYTIAVYFGCVGITRTRHTLVSALTADAVGMICAVLCVMLLGI